MKEEIYLLYRKSLCTPGCVLAIIVLHGYPNGFLCALTREDFQIGKHLFKETRADFQIDKHLFKETNGNYSSVVS